jgi:hypothetical protein
LTALIFVSCTEQEEKVLDISDIMSYSSSDEKDTTSNEQNVDDIGLVEYFTKGNIITDRVEQIELRDFPDRFGPDTTLNIKLFFEGDSLLYTNWTFKDSVKTMNAFYNWIDCFGPNCKSIFVGQEKNLQKPATLILIGDTNIVRIEGDNISFKKWYAFHDSLGYDLNWNYSIEQYKHSRARWFQFEDDKKVKHSK